MKFTKAETKDISLIQKIAWESWQSAYAELLTQEQIEYMLGTMYSEKEIGEQLQNINYQYFIISLDNQNLGFIGYEHHYETETTKLHRIYLLPEAKGKGVGKKTLDFLKEKVAKTADRRIILNVNKNNDAKKFYEACGFSVYDEGVFDMGNGFVMDDYLMEFRLDK
ncbi:MAG: GNAT family N-acetyltransferase [Cruoricaptor ignavus]|nr:GNAT family N-acetyltransferase [Cruoricaptor ignavus]